MMESQYERDEEQGSLAMSPAELPHEQGGDAASTSLHRYPNSVSDRSSVEDPIDYFASDEHHRQRRNSFYSDDDESFLSSQILSSRSSSDDESDDWEDANGQVQQKRILRLRQSGTCLFVYLAIILPIVVYVKERARQVTDFEFEFAAVSSQVVESFGFRLARTLSSMDSLSIGATSFALDTNSTWPFVTLLEFGVLGESTLATANTIHLGFHPLVQVDRQEWENYTAKNIEWYWSAKKMQQELDDYTTFMSSSTLSKRTQHEQDRSLAQQILTTTTTTSTTRTTERYLREPIKGRGGYHKEIYRCSESFNNTIDFEPRNKKQSGPFQVEAGNGPYLPTWQMVPLNINDINYNILSVDEGRKAFAAMNRGGGLALLSRVQNLSSPSTGEHCKVNGTIEQYSSLLQSHFHDSNFMYKNEPTTVLYYPIFDTFDTQSSDDMRKIVGVLSTLIYWPTFFIGVLPDNAKNIICVIKNACGDEFSFEISGDGANYLGEMDAHNVAFDYLRQTFHFTSSESMERTNIKGNGEEGEYEGFFLDNFSFGDKAVMLDDTYCPYLLHVYPADRGETMDKKPMFLAFGIFFSFLFISAISMTYDCVVQRRLRYIFLAAKENSAILASLFPSTVRDKLLQIQAKTQKHSSKGHTANNASNSALHQSDSASSFSHLVAQHPKTLLKSFLDNSSVSATTDSHDNVYEVHQTSSRRLERRNSLFQTESLQENQIAELFPFCTVFFANISGFSAWSSEREPAQIFILLETIFVAFDKIAKRLGVFKVETIADTYVAVTGLPDPQPDHAIRMARFARECLAKVNELTRSLEAALGPGTGDLKMKFGLHSGQVTGGVLRGDKCRFQLFGDTMNVASRMESTSYRNHIQMSPTTAALLKQAGKERWVRRREDFVNVKGKGLFETCWLLQGSSAADGSRTSRRASLAVPSNNTRSTDLQSSLLVAVPEGGVRDRRRSNESRRSSVELSQSGSDHEILWADVTGVFSPLFVAEKKKNCRLIDWFVGLLVVDLKRLVAARDSKQNVSSDSGLMIDPAKSAQREGLIVFDEVVKAFAMPPYDADAMKKRIDTKPVQLDPIVVSQLRDFVAEISEQYHLNPFHNFEHASHVAMSSVKLFNRIVTPQEINYSHPSLDCISSKLHEFTYGITSDPLAQFSVSFSALIHDVDHAGVPNRTLLVENPQLGAKYRNQSIAEQNSVDIAWGLLMNPIYKELVRCICSDENELKRFRKYIVSLVMATDIFNEETKASRAERWEQAFNQPRFLRPFPVNPESDSSKHYSLQGNNADNEDANLKATIVLEHIIQAADVSHTMQHWNVYQKWNERLFMEAYAAYNCGRASHNPSDGWYKAEMSFFDNYIIPLAQKLEECGVFGVSSDECLNYALENRKEWVLRGEELVQEMTVRCQKRKSMEIGGFTPDEIEGFSPQETEYILVRLIKKGHGLDGCYREYTVELSQKAEQYHYQLRAAHAWFDAFELYDRLSTSVVVRKPSVIFPIFSGLLFSLKSGAVTQDNKCTFEQNLVHEFVGEAKLHMGHPIHYIRAIAARYDLLVWLGRYHDALEASSVVQDLYDPSNHSEELCKVYGCDFAAQMYAHCAICYNLVGDIAASKNAYIHFQDKILPFLEPTNFQNIFDCLYPLLGIVTDQSTEIGPSRILFEVLTTCEDGSSASLQSDIQTRICYSVWKPLKFLLLLWHNSDHGEGGEAEDIDVVQWLLQDGENGIFNEFVENVYCGLGCSPNAITAELCLQLAKRWKRYSKLDLDFSRELVQRGLYAVRVAMKCKAKVHSLCKCNRDAIESCECQKLSSGSNPHLVCERINKDLVELSKELGDAVATMRSSNDTFLCLGPLEQESGHSPAKSGRSLTTRLGVIRLQREMNLV